MENKMKFGAIGAVLLLVVSISAVLSVNAQQQKLYDKMQVATSEGLIELSQDATNSILGIEATRDLEVANILVESLREDSEIIPDVLFKPGRVKSKEDRDKLLEKYGAKRVDCKDKKGCPEYIMKVSGLKKLLKGEKSNIKGIKLGWTEDMLLPNKDSKEIAEKIHLIEETAATEVSKIIESEISSGDITITSYTIPVNFTFQPNAPVGTTHDIWFYVSTSTDSWVDVDSSYTPCSFWGTKWDIDLYGYDNGGHVPYINFLDTWWCNWDKWGCSLVLDAPVGYCIYKCPGQGLTLHDQTGWWKARWQVYRTYSQTATVTGTIQVS